MNGVILNGVSSSTLGVIVEQCPVWKLPRKRYNAHSVAAQDGRIYDGDQPYDIFQAIMRINMFPEQVDAVHAWLKDGGWMVSPHAPDKKVFVRLLAESQPTIYKAGDISVTYTLECEPVKYLIPEADEIVLTASGATVHNPGNHYAQPRIVVEGSGAFHITITNGADIRSMYFTKVPADGIIIECAAQMQDAISADGTQLLNHCIMTSSDGFFRLAPGVNMISWAAGAADSEEPGSVSRIRITPRWRSV